METKSFLTSKTIIGALLVLVAPLMNKYFGVAIDEAVQTEIANSLEMAMQSFGALFAIYGRIKADKKISL